MLFAMLRIAVGAWIRDHGEPVELQGKCPDLATSFRYRTIECLSQANHVTPQEHLVEALLLHSYAEFSSSRDFHPDMWVLHGTVVRTSMRLGYHLDPRFLRDVSPYQAEMRRRTWTFIRTSDILLSFQIGLPSMLDPRWLWGQIPQNIHDDDFSCRSDELPVARSDNDATAIISFLISKARILFCFARALKEMEQPDGIPYERVLGLDKEIRHIYRTMPDHYQCLELPESLGPDPTSVALRLVLGGIYHKALCVIHSRFLKAAVTNQQYLYSWLSCTESATILLSIQAFQNRYTYQNGRVTPIIHFQTSLTIHDFFLAATILCTTLLLKNALPSSEIPLSAASKPSKDEVLQALHKSVNTFARSREESVEAARACDLLRALLHELQAPPSRPEQEINGTQPTSDTDCLGPSTTGTLSFSMPGNNNVGAPQTSGIVANDALWLSGNHQTITDANQSPMDDQSYYGLHRCGATETLDVNNSRQPGDWDTNFFSLDLSDPVSFVQSMHFQDMFSGQPQHN